MNQTCEFGRFYYFVSYEYDDVAKCVTERADGSGAFGFLFENENTLVWYLPSDMALIPRMTSWDYDGPRHPEDGWRFLLPDERIELGDEAFSPHQRKWCRRPSLAGDLARECEWVIRRRIEPDHVAELEKAFRYNAITGNVFMHPDAIEDHWSAVKAELLALREQVNGGDA